MQAIARNAPFAAAGRQVRNAEMFCRYCGSIIHEQTATCPHCGSRAPRQDPIERVIAPPEGKSWVVTLLLAFFMPIFGVHRMYVGKVASGVLQMITFGGFFIWWLIDVIRILTGEFTDANGQPLIK
jgi:TM2 domain-containing membrane protein YozV